MNYSSRLFNNYRKTHTIQSGTTDLGRLRYFEEMYKHYYSAFFSIVEKDARILEIGCNVGTLLGVLNREGYSNLTGIDLSPDDLEIARQELPNEIELQVADAFDFLTENNRGKYDCIFSKAVFEHVQKNRVIELLELCRDSLNDGGLFIIDVPNMDWILASHERYMDFTHECGYNSDSLGQLLREVFGNADIFFVNEKDYGMGIKTKLGKMILGRLISWSLQCPSEKAMFSREIVGVARKK